ncbi:LacI family DNA-binding transcriptional regulator [Henriciella aquimarina]|uniref:LacI family DNA-binding transcriptional regulator n=1 Tax=Henriciella aquimarina TaxID=545261 RepID=UPI00117AD0AE|nr:LacI family DNA-binding transcriptional regulator [Henriciella aquimarina]
MTKRRPITIKDVAEKAGVSQMTVSRVLNKQTLVKAATREKVEAAIAALNYQPNLMARGLAGGRSKLIGLAYYNPSPSYLSELLVSALKQCRDLGHHLVIEDLSDIEDALDTSAIVERLRTIHLDALILTPPLSGNAALLQLIEGLGIATVLFGNAGGGGQSSVVFDDAAAAHAMTEHLIAHQHSRIGFVRGPDEHPSSAQRAAGYEKALSEHGLALDEQLVCHGDFTFRSGMAAGEVLLGQTVPPTAIFASNDDMAAGVIAAAHRRGLQVPAQLSVAGFDDTAIAAAIWPPLTTVRQPIAEMAQAAIGLITEVTGEDWDGQPLNRVNDIIRIVERESVGPPA